MSAQKLQCGVSQELYDAYRALIPEGVALPTHLRGLVQNFVAGLPTPEVDIEALKAEWYEKWKPDRPTVLTSDLAAYTDPETLIQRQAVPAPVVAESFVGSGLVVTDGRPDFQRAGTTVTVTRPPLAGATGACLHPHGTLVREGRFVRCTLCDQIVR